MKSSKASKLNVVVIWILGGLLLILAVDFYLDATARGKATSAMVSAREHLDMGMSPDEADAFLNAAWREYHCDYGIFSEHIYLFGNGDPDLSSILFLRFDKTNNGKKLTRTASVEPYRLNQFEHCQITE